jgi:hypothetical protein
MTDPLLDLRSRLSAAHAEALRVHDSPIRADRVGEEIQKIVSMLDGSDLPEDRRARVGSALQDALRVLRRDDDGREAARHLQTAMSQLEGGPPRRQSPFLDD